MSGGPSNGSAGITAWGAYLPYWRLRREAIAEALGQPSGRGCRAVASFDEDTTTMAVEAGRRGVAAHAAHGGDLPTDLLFSTPAPAYLDKTVATSIAAALGLPDATGAYDLGGSARSGIGALRAGLALAAEGSPVLVAVSDLRTGPAGSTEERDSGDGAAAFVLGTSGVVAEVLGRASVSHEFLDRWRTGGETTSRVWEERFGQEVYVPLARAAFEAALERAGVDAGGVDHLVMGGLHQRAVRAVVSEFGVPPGARVDDLVQSVGNLGAAQVPLLLADVLDRAAPGEVIAVVSLADGADAIVLVATDALPAMREARAAAGLHTVSEMVEEGRDDLPYTRFLTWRGELRRDPPRRPDPDRPGAPATWRSGPWRSGFDASACTECGFRHLPPTRVCLRCRAVDRMQLVRLADERGRVATFTVDHLAYSLSPPVVGAVVDFDTGGRYRCEMTDVDPGAVAIGTPVEMTFRRIFTAQGVHNYFWKAKPITGGRP